MNLLIPIFKKPLLFSVFFTVATICALPVAQAGLFDASQNVRRREQLENSKLNAATTPVWSKAPQDDLLFNDVENPWPILQYPSTSHVAGEFPADPFRILNTSARQTWLKILNCVGGDQNAAREAYRSKHFPCANEAEITKSIIELHTTVATLEETVEVHFLASHRGTIGDLQDLHATLAAEDRVHPRRMGPPTIPTNGDVVKFMAEERAHQNDPPIRTSYSLTKEQMEFVNGFLAQVGDGSRFDDLMAKEVPDLPNAHPLLVQILIETFAHIVPVRATVGDMRALMKSGSESAYKITQTAIWMHLLTPPSSCSGSSFGLWPSSNRATMAYLNAQVSRLRSVLYSGWDSTDLWSVPVCPARDQIFVHGNYQIDLMYVVKSIDHVKETEKLYSLYER